MKVILFLLIPVIIFPQSTDYPDTLYLKSGVVYPCFITNVDNKIVKVIDKHNIHTSAGTTQINKIFIKEFNIVYENEQYTTDIEILNEKINKRNIEIKKVDKFLINTTEEFSVENNFSFGVVYNPFLDADLFLQRNSPYGSLVIYIEGKIKSFIESQFSYRINPNLSVIFDLGYGSSYVKERTESHYIYGSYNTDNGEEYINEMDIYMISLGLKYYLKKILENEVSPYFQVGFGKQFSFADHKEKNLYPNPNLQSSSTDNASEFLEDINSPFLFYFGFGTEYFFNKALSVNANMQFSYVTYSGEYKYEYNRLDEHNTEILKIENSEFIKKVGLGLNFYF